MNRARGVLFDLDGTLADTAADLTAALNHALAGLGVAPLPLETTRPYVSRGAGALLQLALGAAAGDPRIEASRPRFLAWYADHLCIETRLYPGIAALLESLADQEIAWGVVTNKPRAYTVPLLDDLPLPHPPASIVCADDLPHKKPHPLPVRHACAALGALPGDCLFVGDDRRDVTAGFRAGTVTAAAAWGYIGPGESPRNWGADLVADHAGCLTAWLDDD